MKNRIRHVARVISVTHVVVQEPENLRLVAFELQST